MEENDDDGAELVVRWVQASARKPENDFYVLSTNFLAGLRPLATFRVLAADLPLYPYSHRQPLHFVAKYFYVREALRRLSTKITSPPRKKMQIFLVKKISKRNFFTNLT